MLLDTGFEGVDRVACRSQVCSWNFFHSVMRRVSIKSASMTGLYGSEPMCTAG